MAYTNTGLLQQICIVCFCSRKTDLNSVFHQEILWLQYCGWTASGILPVFLLMSSVFFFIIKKKAQYITKIFCKMLCLFLTAQSKQELNVFLSLHINFLIQKWNFMRVPNYLIHFLKVCLDSHINKGLLKRHRQAYLAFGIFINFIRHFTELILTQTKMAELSYVLSQKHNNPG